jgi:hypothetical protein
MNEQLPSPEAPKFIVNPIQRRRDLLPLWIKIFTWIFLSFFIAVPFAIVFTVLNKPFTLSLLGLSTAEPFSAMGLCLMALFTLKGIAAYALWMEKNWAITLAQVDAVISLVICLFAMVYGAMNFQFTIRFEPIIIVFYLIKLRDIKSDWKYFNTAPEAELV